MKELFATYAPRVYLFALRLAGSRHEAEDLVQDTFVQALRHQSRLRDATAARAWLFTITANLWRSRLRRKGREKEVIRDVEQMGTRSVPLPEHGLIVREDMRRVREAINGLPKRQQEILHLHAYESFSLAEIAKILGISAEAVKASLSLARKRMRQQLRDLDDGSRPATPSPATQLPATRQPTT